MTFLREILGGGMEWVWLQCFFFKPNLTGLRVGVGSYFLQYFCFLFSINISFYP